MIMIPQIDVISVGAGLPDNGLDGGGIGYVIYSNRSDIFSVYPFPGTFH